MKKLLLVLMVVAMSFALVAIAIGQPVNNVKNTKHNLSTSGSGTFKSTNEDQICVFCHTPHQSGTSTDPLWNHTLSSQSNYGVYASNSFNGSATIADISVGGNNTSLLCMSCHDGTVALNSLYNPSNDLGGANPAGNLGTLTGTANLGTDLTNDHPVNFTYDGALVTADGGAGLNDPAATIVPGYTGTINGVLLSGGKVQCSSCHGPHIDYSGANSGYAPFLKVNNTGSALCLTCHIK